MRKDCELSYRKIKAISIHGNSARNLILRQQFAVKFLQLSNPNKVFLNVDETWLGMSDFRRMKLFNKAKTDYKHCFSS